MKIKKKFFLIFSLLFYSNTKPFVEEEVKESKKKLPKMKQFEEDFLKIFPYYDFKDENVYRIIAYFQVVLKKNGFKKAFNCLNDLQTKYSNELEIVRTIFFFKYVICYVFFEIKPYSDVHKQYARIASINFKHAKNIQKIMFLFRDQFYSNESEYSISIKFADHDELKKRGVSDNYLDSLFELMKLSKEYLALKVLNESLNSWYGESWVESAWYSSESIEKNLHFRNLDIYYYVLIEFLFYQNLIDKALYLYNKMQKDYPTSVFTILAEKFFEKSSN